MNKLLIFDTHCHLADESYDNYDINQIIQEAQEKGVKFILNVGESKKTNQKIIRQLENYPNLFAALGLHPNSDEDLEEENLKWIERQLNNKKIVAIGEIGLDYYRTFTSIEKQKHWFKKQLELAKKYDLPVLLHIREAFEDAYKIVKELEINKGVLHCFTGNWEKAQKFLNLGFYISFAGNITYKNSKWQERWGEVIKKIPLEKIVIETDAPYLSPEPLRGQINYPQNIVYTLKKIAEIKNQGLNETANIIYANTLKLFSLEKSITK